MKEKENFLFSYTIFPTQHSHLDDCGKFYKCSNGRGYLFDCPSDEHWSVKLDRCDYPPLAGCKVDGHHQYKLKKVLPRQANGNEESIDADNESSNNDFEIDPRCEGGDPFKPLHYQHPSDCTKFYKCYMGKAYVIKCPRGQHWSQKLNRCEHPSLARCHIVKPAAASLIVPFMDIPEEKLQKIPTIIDDSDYMIEDPRCEVDEADRFHPIHFSHPSDCQMFYKCFNNLAFKSTCPNGLHYNAKTQACDYPPVAKCKLAVKIVPAQMLSVKVPSIPDCTHGRSVSFGLQGSLKRYFQCRNGEVFLMECSEDQFFNPNSMQCDYFPGEQQPSVSGSQWPIKQAYSQYNSYYPMYNYPNYYPDWQQNSDWQQYPDWQKNNKQETSDFPSWLPQPNQNAGKPSVNKPPKESARDDNSFDFGKGKTSSRCPVHEDDMHPVLLAHESDCKKFYKCFRQKAFLLSCPEGEEFSEKLKRCDYHQYANCDPAELIRRKIQM